MLDANCGRCGHKGSHNLCIDIPKLAVLTKPANLGFQAVELVADVDDQWAIEWQLSCLPK